jgi:subtilase family serine protease
LVKTLTKLLDSYALGRKIIVYVKDEGSNLNIMITMLKSIISCDMLGLEESFQGICFGHAFSKACQYVTTKEFFCKDLQYVSIKSVQRDLHKCITWPKKSSKGKQKWEKACENSSLFPQKLNTPKF